MAAKNLDLALRIKADLDAARRDLDKLTDDIDDVGEASDKTNKKFDNFGGTIKRVATLTAVAFAAQKVLRVADDYGALQNRLRLVTDTQGELATVTQQVFDISQQTSSAIDATATIYQRFAQNGEALNITQAETARLTEIVAKSIAITGGNAASSEAALTQFGQALSSGVLRGDEFRSISEQAQGLRDALAKGLGVEIGELKKMADAGLLTSDVLVKALLAAEGFVDEKFDTRVKLMSQSLVELDNSLTFLIGDTVTGTGVTNELADSVSSLAEVLQAPGTKAAFTAIIELVAGLASGAIGLASELGDFGISVNTFVQTVNGTLDPLERLERQIYDVQKAQRGWLAGGIGFLFTSQDELKQLEAQLKAERDLLLEAQKKKGAAEGVGGAEPDGADPIVPPAINKEYQTLLANLKKQSALFGETGEAAKVRYAIEQKLLGELNADQQTLLLKYAEQIDASKAAAEQAKTAKSTADALAKSQRAYVGDLERQVAILSLNAQQVQAYELAEKKLTGALLARAQAAQAAITADQQKQQSDADAATLSGIRAQLLRGQGDESGALAIELGQQFAEISQRLQAVGDTEGVALIDRLINVKQASARMSELQAELDRLFADQSRTEQSIQTQVDAGSISELSARQQIVDLHAATAAEVERLLPLMQELAAVTGDPAALARVKDLQAELGRMRVVVDETTQAIQRGFEDGLSNALEGLATRTLTIREAVQGMAKDIARSLAQLAAQKIANSVATSIFGGGDQGAELTKGAAAVTASSLALGTASASLVPGALAIEVAATSLLAAAVAAQGAGSGGSSGSTASLLTSVAGLFSGGGGTVAAAGGGQVLGPGTPTSDSIPALLSHTEFVTRGAVVTQPGALGFLHDFNARGMAALNDYALRVRHNTGGLAGAPAPSMPAPSGRLAQPAAALAAPQVTNNQRFMLIDDPDRIADGMRGSQGEEVVFLHLSRNPGKVKQILGGA